MTSHSSRAGRAELAVALALTVVILALLVQQALRVSALWRDECAAVQLALLPTFAEVVEYFEFEAFPLLFPTTIRGVAAVFGHSDAVFRGFGLVVGLLLLAAIWANARLQYGGPPLLMLLLLGFNPVVLRWGTTIRGYGLGTAALLLTLGLMTQLRRAPTWRRALPTLAAALIGVHLLLHNSFLLAAMGVGGIAISLWRRNFRAAGALLGVGILCALSVLPYIPAYASGNAWNMLVKHPADAGRIADVIDYAIGGGESIVGYAWAALLPVGMIGAALGCWRAGRAGDSEKCDDLFGGLAVSLLAILAYAGFLAILRYPTQPWYYLPLLGLLAANLDLFAFRLAPSVHWRRGLLAAVMVCAALQAAPTWTRLQPRQTNIDRIAGRLRRMADAEDLIVVLPWNYGVTFNWYYSGAAPWVTVPPIDDLRMHRYDLVKARMMEGNPIQSVLDRIRDTLRAGNQVFVVGPILYPAPAAPPWPLPPAPDSEHGWSEVAYLEAWAWELGAYVAAHADTAEQLADAAGEQYHPVEHVQLTVIRGWYDAPPQAE